MYALKEKGRFAFLCMAETPKKFDEKVQKAYWGWRGLQPRASAASFDEFLAKYDKVSVSVEPYTEMPKVTVPENGQRYQFNVGDKVVSGEYSGTVVKVHEGQLNGMVDVRLPGGVVCLSSCYPEVYPDKPELREVVKQHQESLRAEYDAKSKAIDEIIKSLPDCESLTNSRYEYDAGQWHGSIAAANNYLAAQHVGQRRYVVHDQKDVGGLKVGDKVTITKAADGFKVVFDEREAVQDKGRGGRE